jgi:hypothetical protein
MMIRLEQPIIPKINKIKIKQIGKIHLYPKNLVVAVYQHTKYLLTHQNTRKLSEKNETPSRYSNWTQNQYSQTSTHALQE